MWLFGVLVGGYYDKICLLRRTTQFLWAKGITEEQEWNFLSADITFTY